MTTRRAALHPKSLWFVVVAAAAVLGWWVWQVGICEGSRDCRCVAPENCDPGLECHSGYCWDVEAEGPDAPYFLSAEDSGLTRPAREHVAANARVGRHGHVADIGAGWGADSLRLAEVVGREGRVYATDIEPRMVSHLQQAAVQWDVPALSPRLVQGRRALGLDDAKDGTLDLALFIDSVKFLEGDPRDEDVRYLSELRRKMKPDAQVFYHFVWLESDQRDRDATADLFRAAGFTRVRELPMPEGMPAHRKVWPMGRLGLITRTHAQGFFLELQP
ncbi:MAG: class I SAM-dependent methyltransferase [Myxococcota bacterium]